MIYVPRRSIGVLGAFVVLLAGAPLVLAQRDGVPIEPRRLPASDKVLLAKLAALKEEGKLLSMAEVEEALQSPTPQAITLPSVATEPRDPTEIAALGRQRLLRVGWYYLCHRCNNWHVLSAGGYALTSDGVAVSCYHVLQPQRQTMREGYLFAMNTDGEVFAITTILAADEALDAAVFRMDGSGFTPVPLNDQTAPGERVYLVSDPRSVAGYFSAGHINRFYWNGDRGDEDLESLKTVRNLRIDVSTAWSPGSSGAAIMDERGNAIGHVTKIAVEREPQQAPAPEPVAASDPSDDPSTQPATQPSRRNEAYLIVLHEAVPARGVRLLVESMNDAAGAAAAD